MASVLRFAFCSCSCNCSYTCSKPCRYSTPCPPACLLACPPACRLFTDFVWEFSLPAGEQLPYHRLKRGDTLIITPASQHRRSDVSGPSSSSGGSSDGGGCAAGTGSGGEGEVLEATVLEVHRQEVLVTLSKAVAEELGAAPAGGRSGGWAIVLRCGLL